MVATVSIKGNAFFLRDSRFYIRGVDYQPGGTSHLADPITDEVACTRDVPMFQELGINTIRLYAVDNSADHDLCMQLLADAGIYVIVDLSTPDYSLNRTDIAGSYNDLFLQNAFATVDVFQRYTNTLAFISANKIIIDGPSSATAPYIKAVTRDVRRYIRSRGYRTIPVGYSAADVDVNTIKMARYMNCGTDEERSDFFAFNDYSWCDPSGFWESGWGDKVEKLTGLGTPLFLSEYGCNKTTRKFDEVRTLYSTDATGVYSGGLIYEYSDEGNGHGLVTIGLDRAHKNNDFEALKAVFHETSDPADNGGCNKCGGVSGCPAYSEPNWLVRDDPLPAIPPPSLEYMTHGAGKAPGFKGPGSQNRGKDNKKGH